MTSTTELLKVRDQRTALLLEAIELLVEEIAVLAARDWEKLPDLKKRKVVAASGLRRLRAETEAADGAPITSIESLIADLEEQSQRNIRARLDLKPGDVVRYRVTESGVVIDKLPQQSDEDALASFSEWTSATDDEAYSGL